MKTLQFMQRMFVLMGFNSNNSLWNVQYLIGFATAGLSIPSFSIFLFHEAESVKEFTDSVYLTAVSITLFVSYINTILKRSELLNLFEVIEENVNNSKYSVKILRNHYDQSRRVAKLI